MVHTFTTALFSLALLVLTQAQAPIARRRLAYVQNGSTFYIQGGFTTTNFSPQLNSLDLSTSWTLSNPAWTQLQDGPLVSHQAMVLVAPQHAAGLGAGKQGYLLSIAGSNTLNFWSTFNLAAATWTTLAGAPAPYPSLEGHAAVTDPGTGLIYIIGGYSGNTTYNALTVFDPSTRTIVSKQNATNVNTTSLTDTAAVWSTVRSTVMTFGGSRAPPAVTDGLGLTSVNEYDPVTKSWKTYVTSGAIPTRRLDHCVAASEDGSKIVLFGGSLDVKTFFYDIYILDVSTATWRQGNPAGSPRTRMSCAFHSNQFIAWGGSSGDNRSSTMQNNIPIIYDIIHDSWGNGYGAAGPNPNQPSSSPTSPSSGPSAGDNKNLGPIIGGASAGVLVLAGCVVAIFVVSRRKKRIRKDQAYEDARTAAALAGDEDDDRRHGSNSRGGSRQQRYSNVNTAEDSDMDGSNNTSERHLGKMRPSDHYAAAEALRGGRVNPSTSAGIGTRSAAPVAAGVTAAGGQGTGYWDTFSGSPESGGMRPVFDASVPLAEYPYNNYSQPVAAVYGGASPLNPSLTQWPAAHNERLQHQYQNNHKQEVLQGPSYTPPAPPLPLPFPSPPQSTSSAYPYNGRYSDVPRSSMADSNGGLAFLQYPNHSRVVSNVGDPYYSGMDHSGPYSVRDSVSTFSDTKTTASGRSPQAIRTEPPEMGYVLPPPTR